MKWRPFSLGGLLVAALLLGAGGVAALDGADQINPNHAGHAKAKVDCLACHEPIFDETSLGQPGVFPKEAKCLSCHKKEKEEGKCSMCHLGKPGPYVLPPPHLKFDHAKHLEKDEKCEVCHLTLPARGQLDRPVPPMQTCLNCHQHNQQYAAGNCNVCHLDMLSILLKPTTPPFNHQGNFVRGHVPIARASSAACTECHQQSFCADCHSAMSAAVRIEAVKPDAVDKNFIHWGDYLTRHSVEARANESRCQNCHVVSFCEQCHQAAQLTPSSNNPQDPHPAGWLTPGSPNFHGTAARQDIVSCASCHDQGAQSNCVTCHRVGGPGGNPHPSGFTSRHPPSEINRNSMCQTCH
ncbi:MAG: cytochrome c3 family protein [Myxococcaceae bacterium]